MNIHTDRPVRDLAAGMPADRPDSIQWDSAPLGHLLDHIVVEHHAYTRETLTSLTPMLAKVLRSHGTRPPNLETVATLFLALQQDLLPHMLKEERVLFPAMRAWASGHRSALPFGSFERPLWVMGVEHDAVEQLLQELRHTTNEYTLPADACETFRGAYAQLEALEADLRVHMHLENDVLFPRTLRELQA